MILMFSFLKRSFSMILITGMLAALSSAALAQTTRSQQKAAKTPARSVSKDRAQSSAKATSADKTKKNTDKDRAKNANANNKRDPKKEAEAKRQAAENARIADERRQAALAEQRRREQAAAEARARKLAFERGLRSETIANISKDRTEGEDLRIRRAAIAALGDHAGSIVVMEAQTGKVLTIVNQQWAVRDTVKPCSTIKLVTGVAGLSEKVIDPSNGAVRGASTRRLLDDAFAYSDNPYFQRVGANLGSEKVTVYARDLGLGQQTGINIEGEVAGRMPMGNNNPRIYSHGDDYEVTPIQLAVMVSAITNGGHRVLPRVPRNEVEKVKFQPFYRANLKTDQRDVRRVIPGMMGAAEYGTAHRGVDASMGVAGKTGSCISRGTWAGLFASVAPVESPKYAVVVVTKGQAERGKYAAAIAGKVYSALAGDIVRTDRDLAQTEFKVQPKRPIVIASAPPTTTAIKGMDNDDDDDDADDNYASPSKDRQVIKTVPPVIIQNRPLVKRTGSSKPTNFQPIIITYDRSGAIKDDEK